MKQSTKKLLRQLLRQQRRNTKLLEAFADQFAELRVSAAIDTQHQTLETIESLRAALGDLSGGSLDRAWAELSARFDDVLVAQQRTNQLLELTLRAGFDNEELLRER